MKNHYSCIISIATDIIDLIISLINFSKGVKMNSINLIPPNNKRVEMHTKNKINKRIVQKTEDNLKKFQYADSDSLSERIKQLNREWDTERVLEANAATIIFVSSVIGFIYTPYWFILTGIISFFLFEHAIQGWCPPLPLIRRLGVRTQEEIQIEKMTIKFMRGDFYNIGEDPLKIMNAIKKEYL